MNEHYSITLEEYLQGELGDLPPHDSDRTATTDGLDNPDVSNGMRAENGRAHATAGNEKDPGQEELSDIICNVLHYAHSREMDIPELLASAALTFSAEAGPLE